MASSSAETNNPAIKAASNAAMASLLNLTFLPGVGFLWMLLRLRRTDLQAIEHYHLKLGIKLNLNAAFALLAVSGAMILMGGFQSAWTWVYVITYFTFVHTAFIVIAVWALVRAWSGQKLNKFRKEELIG